jgi:hypothetical protein
MSSYKTATIKQPNLCQLVAQTESSYAAYVLLKKYENRTDQLDADGAFNSFWRCSSSDSKAAFAFLRRCLSSNLYRRRKYRNKQRAHFIQI